MWIANLDWAISFRLLLFVIIILINLSERTEAARSVRKVSSHYKNSGRDLQLEDSTTAYDSYSLCGSLKGPKCRKSKNGSRRKIPSYMSYKSTLSEPKSSTRWTPLTTTIVPIISYVRDTSEFSLSTFSNSSIPELNSLAKFMIKQRKKCKLTNYKGFKCQKLKWYVWLMNEFEKNTTKLNSWVELVRNTDLIDESRQSRSDLMPENWQEDFVFKLLQKWGDPVDQFVFHKYKLFSKSRELKFQIPHMLEIKVSPRTHELIQTGRSTPRIFWDPGFNLKLKLPFFKDELKVAISTGPSFLAGIGTGIVILIIKSLFAPFLFGLKYMLYNMFWKDMDMFKMLGWGSGGGHNPEPWESNAPPPAIEHYEPPPVHNHYDNMNKEPHSGFGYGYNNGYDQKLQFSQLNPILQGITGASNVYKSSLEDGRHQRYKALLTAPPDEPSGGTGFGNTGPGSTISESQDNVNVKDGSYNYIPSTALQAEVENYDPFYSPLLSRIDSIFTHLGYQEEGCRERAVCSIYKFPVKYAPYSNLLSAQLSKHQSELKKPVTSSPKVLRYFKYMKAAKDGQGQLNCMEAYPKCDHDTDSVTNLPMITTFNQLTELMGAEGTGPSAS